MKIIILVLSLIVAGAALSTGKLTELPLPERFTATSDMKTVAGLVGSSAVIYTVSTNATQVIAPNATAAVISADGLWMAVGLGKDTTIYKKGDTWTAASAFALGADRKVLSLFFSKDATRLVVVDKATISYLTRTGDAFSLDFSYDHNSTKPIKAHFDDQLENGVFFRAGFLLITADFTNKNTKVTVISNSTVLGTFAVINNRGTAICASRTLWMKTNDAWRMYTLLYDMQDYELGGQTFSADGNVLIFMGDHSIYRYMLTSIKGDRVPYDRSEPRDDQSNAYGVVSNNDGTFLFFQTRYLGSVIEPGPSYSYAYEAKPYANGTLCTSDQDCAAGSCGSGNLCYAKGTRAELHGYDIWCFNREVNVRWTSNVTPDARSCESAGSVSPGARQYDGNLQFGFNNTFIQVAEVLIDGKTGPFHNVSFVGPLQPATFSLLNMNLNSEKVMVRLTVLCQDAYANSEKQDTEVKQDIAKDATKSTMSSGKTHKGAATTVAVTLAAVLFAVVVVA